MTEQKLSLTELLAAQTQGRFFGPQPPEAYEKPTNIVVAGNGIFRVVKTPIALFKVKIEDTKTPIPGLKDMEEGPELLIPKIPVKYLTMILTFYRDVHAKDKTEASALFFWNHNDVELPTNYEPTTYQKNRGESGDPVKGIIQDGKLIVYCPQQKNSSGLSEFGDDGMVNYLREHCTPLCETHSHHTMGAFWSGTDDANENMTQFYGVWGNIDKDQPNFLFRWVCGDKKINIEPSILFDIPQIETKTITNVKTITTIPGQEPIVEEETEEEVVSESFKGPWERVEAPEDWMGQHSKSWTSYGGYKGGAYTKTGGATPSEGGASRYGAYQWGDDRYQEGYGYDGYSGYGHNGYGAYGSAGGYQDKKYLGASHEEEKVKKNMGSERKISDEIKTTVEVFLEKEVSGDKSVAETEEMVGFLIEELIELGYDHIISDTMQDNSGYANMYGQGYDF